MRRAAVSKDADHQSGPGDCDGLPESELARVGLHGKRRVIEEAEHG